MYILLFAVLFLGAPIIVQSQYNNDMNDFKSELINEIANLREILYETIENHNLEMKNNYDFLNQTVAELKNKIKYMSEDINQIQRSQKEIQNIIDDIPKNLDPNQNLTLHNLKVEVFMEKILEIINSTSTSTPNPNKHLNRNCKEIQDYNIIGTNKSSGVYLIQPNINKPAFKVFCDMDTRDGGWTVIQKRYDGSQDFHLGYKDYQAGFGDLEKEFWIGLDHLHELTSQESNELVVEMENIGGEKGYAQYETFNVGNRRNGYLLEVKGYSGDAGDSLAFHNGNKFYTNDMSKNSDSAECARKHGGAWWYGICRESDLNAKYFNDFIDVNTFQGIRWKTFQNSRIKSTKMLIRPF